MKNKTFLLVLFCSIYFTINAQESKPKVKEVGITFYNFQQYGLQYNVGNGTGMWRFRLLNGGINLNHNTNEPSNTWLSRQLRANIGASIGREKRKSVAEKINFVYGIELNVNYTFLKSESIIGDISKYHQMQAGLIGVLGMRYEINSRFYANAELLPSLMYQFRGINSNNSATVGTSTNRISLGFGNNSALLSVGIKF